MIKIYNTMLKLSNPKLYNSPYNHNIIEVSKILDGYTIKFKIQFLKNFRTLKIEEMTDKEKEENEDNIEGIYYPNKNIIKLLSITSETARNHELFHSASGEGIEGIFTGKNLNEGITEYFAIKSQKKEKSDSGYQKELFVIEILTEIYGEQILKPYFLGNQNAFYSQFNDKERQIISYLDKYLKKLNLLEEILLEKITLLILTDIYPKEIPLSNNFFKPISLSPKDAKIIKEKLKEYKNIIKKIIEKNKDLSINNHTFQNKEKQEIYNIYQEEYNTKIKEIFKIILDNLIFLARTNGKSNQEIELILNKIIPNKDNEFIKLFIETSNLYKEKNNHKRR